MIRIIKTKTIYGINVEECIAKIANMQNYLFYMFILPKYPPWTVSQIINSMHELSRRDRNRKLNEIEKEFKFYVYWQRENDIEHHISIEDKYWVLRYKLKLWFQCLPIIKASELFKASMLNISYVEIIDIAVQAIIEIESLNTNVFNQFLIEYNSYLSVKQLDVIFDHYNYSDKYMYYPFKKN